MPKAAPETYELSRELASAVMARVGILRLNQVVTLEQPSEALVSREYRVTFELAGTDARTALVSTEALEVAQGAYQGAFGIINALEAKKDARAERKAKKDAAAAAE